jgi:hypothetical protein
MPLRGALGVLAYGVLRPRVSSTTDGKEPPIF